MPVPSRPWLIAVAAGAALVVVLLGVAVTLSWAPLPTLDAAIGDPVHAWALGAPWAVQVSEVLAVVGRFATSFWVVVATAVLVLVVRRSWRVALAVVLVAIVAPQATDQLKEVVARSRPVWEQPLSIESTWAYPSGHATAGIAVYAVCGLALAWLVPDRRGARLVAGGFLALGIAIGLSRVVLGVHWPSDVVGGWAVAVSVTAATAALLLAGRPVRGEEPAAEGVSAVRAR